MRLMHGNPYAVSNIISYCPDSFQQYLGVTNEPQSYWQVICFETKVVPLGLSLLLLLQCFLGLFDNFNHVWQKKGDLEPT